MKKSIFLFFLFIVMLFVVSCTSNTTKEPTIINLGPEKFSQVISDESVFVLDVHIPEQEHIEGTNEFIPYNEIEINLDKLPSDKDTPIAIYCRSGSMSDEASKTLQSLGYNKVYNLLGGANAWRESGLNFDSELSSYKFVSNKITVYKSASCGCCVGYISELRNQGFEVEIVNVDYMGSIKDRYGIPINMQSCHTAVIGDYFIEGHVPMEAVYKLLEDRPAIDGIALPDMPTGSPGMPGFKSGPFKVYALSGGDISIFMNS